MSLSRIVPCVPMCFLLAVVMVWSSSASGADPADGGVKKGASAEDKAAAVEAEVTQGALRIVGDDGTVVECPLRHTDVAADVSGFIARVKVTQTFVNPSQEKIEAVYVFPLPHEAAVDDMTMVIGDRRIVGLIKRRDDARRIYQEALSAGQTAALLEQERPNIFTQSVGNIGPGQEVNIEISYVDVLKYDLGTYEFHFPMVVGPRYNPGGSIAAADGATVNPPVLKPGERNGHDISLTVNLDAGVPIQNLSNANHKVQTLTTGDRQARIRLLQEDSLPNKDFVLRYDVAGKKPEMALLAHTGDYSGDNRRLGNGYFLLLIQPQEDERLKKSPPREVVFLVDVSGSMSGEPTAKVVDAMQNMLKLCREQDTVQVITFASQAAKLFDKAVPVNEANIKRALDFTSGLQGSGGTEMLPGIKLAIDEPVDKQRLRIVVMLTDGYIGNEAEIIEHVGKHCGDQVRFWAIGIGASPNMFLIDGVAKQGGGMGKKLALEDDTVALTQEVMTRIQRAQLANVKIDWGKFHVAETYPARLPELWAGRPVIVSGRYTGGGEGQIDVHGTVEGEAVSWPLTVSFPDKEPEHDVLAKVWARHKIEDLMHQTYYFGSPAIEEEVTAIALDYRLMSQYTSFVAVDAEKIDELAEPARPPRRIAVPVPLPAGTRWEGFFGENAEFANVEFDGAGIGGGGFGGRSGAMNGLGPAHASPLVRLKAEPEARVNRLYYYRDSLGETKRNAAGANFGSTRNFGYSGDVATRGGYALNLQRSLKSPQQSVAHSPASVSGRPRRLTTGHPIAELFDVEEQAPDDSAEGRGRSIVAQSLAPQAAALVEAARKALEQGQQQLQQDDLPAARSALVRAYLLDNGAMNFGESDGQIAAEALVAIEEIHDRQVESWSKTVPALSKKLDLVIRDSAIADALQHVAQAAGLKIEIVEGSVPDAASLLGRDEVRVNFLDLRRATTAQALDWLLQPAQLNWSLVDGRIVVRSDRRDDSVAAWVYDVETIAIPAVEELGGGTDQKKLLIAAKDSADLFLSVVRSELKSGDAQNVEWFAPGHLLVFGDAALHAKAAKLLTDLSDAKFQPRGAAAKLYDVTRPRAEQRKPQVAELAAAQRKYATALAHEQFGWQLLSAAAGGKLDLEALTELQIAWRDKATGELLAGRSAVVPLRSLWMICEASRALPDERELAQLAHDALAQSAGAADLAIAALEKNKDDANALARLLFATLARRDDAELIARALPKLSHAADGAETSALGTIARALLQTPSDEIRAELARVLSSGVAGDDLVTLLALACRRAGDESWLTFRESADELLGRQPLRGEVLVLVSRLPARQLPLLTVPPRG